MVESVWRRRAPVWLRIVTGILLFPALWFVLGVGLTAVLQLLKVTEFPGWQFLLLGAAAGVATLVIARKSSIPIAVALVVVALFTLRWILSVIWKVAQALPPEI